MEIKRSFKDIPEGKLMDADQSTVWRTHGWKTASDWNDLLRSKRVLIVSEAGVGKTYECQTQQKRLFGGGKPAFFLNLADLAKDDLRSLLRRSEVDRLEKWADSQSELATFFLDAIDELKLSRASFRRALLQLEKEVGRSLSRVQLVITTRPTPFDEQLVREIFPVRDSKSVEISGEAFARIVTDRAESRSGLGDERARSASAWRHVVLLPLSDEQIQEFAKGQGVEAPENLYSNLKRRNALDFARRPQDLIELCADWRVHKRIRTHRDQVIANIELKLRPREDRSEPAELSPRKALEGASRLALASMMTRRLTIRHNAEADIEDEECALDPAVILEDWAPNERKALLERPLFGFASYGRVRFHHRSVAEFLAANRIKELRETSRIPTRSLHRILFSETKGRRIVRPSKRPMAGWLALHDSMVFEFLRDHEPSVLLTEGDPESLTSENRKQALRAFVKRFGQGGWRGLDVPDIQIHRFANPDLAGVITSLWREGVENYEVQAILLQLIEEGEIAECADLAYQAATDPDANDLVRVCGIKALSAISDGRLSEIAKDFVDSPGIWPNRFSGLLAAWFFPEYISPSDLHQILTRVPKKRERSLTSDIRWSLARHFESIEMDLPRWRALRDCLVDVVSDGLCWLKLHPHVDSKRSDYGELLAIVCLRGLELEITSDWLFASVLALRLPRRDHYCSREDLERFETRLSELSAADSERLFWIEDSFLQELNPESDSSKRYSGFFLQGATNLNRERDRAWVESSLAATSRPLDERSLLLEAALRMSPSKTQEGVTDYLNGLRVLVSDSSKLQGVVDERLVAMTRKTELNEWEIQAAEERNRHLEEQDAIRKSWVFFWKEVRDHPEEVFATDRAAQTAWNLWRAMDRDESGDSDATGWNRHFIESFFSKETADQLRTTLMEQWRKDRPTLVSERPAEEKNKYLVRWQFGLAALYAEAEDPEWATKLSDEEARLATRYVSIEFNGFPSWLESLARAKPDAVKAILVPELQLEFEAEPRNDWYLMTLQNVLHSTPLVAKLFLPTIFSWLEENHDRNWDPENIHKVARRMRQVVSILRKFGDVEMLDRLLRIGRRQMSKSGSDVLFAVFYPVIAQYEVVAGIGILEAKVADCTPSKYSAAVKLIGGLFDSHGHGEGVVFSDPPFSPKVLLRLVRLFYHHVRPEEDLVHEGSYTPDVRDNAEQVRSSVVNLLLNAKGEEGWAAKQAMANEPCCAHFRDRIHALAEERWAEEIDSEQPDESEVVRLEKSGETSPSCNEAMFRFLVDRLEELDDRLLRDASPREAWSSISLERPLRSVIAHELENMANGVYRVDMEAVTADEKETDIRMRSNISDFESVIELKIADGRSARDLRDTLRGQLVTKYLAPETRRSGCLLFSVSKHRKWEHPKTRKRMDLGMLVEFLREESQRICMESGGGLRIHVHALDLRPRLGTEKTQSKT